MPKTSAMCGPVCNQKRPAAGAKLAVRRGGSGLSLGRALGFRVFPTLLVASGMVAIPGNLLDAMEGARGKAHVRVSIPATTSEKQLSAQKAEDVRLLRLSPTTTSLSSTQSQAGHRVGETFADNNPIGLTAGGVRARAPNAHPRQDNAPHPVVAVSTGLAGDGDRRQLAKHSPGTRLRPLDDASWASGFAKAAFVRSSSARQAFADADAVPPLRDEANEFAPSLDHAPVDLGLSSEKIELAFEPFRGAPIVLAPFGSALPGALLVPAGAVPWINLDDAVSLDSPKPAPSIASSPDLRAIRPQPTPLSRAEVAAHEHSEVSLDALSSAPGEFIVNTSNAVLWPDARVSLPVSAALKGAEFVSGDRGLGGEGGADSLNVTSAILPETGEVPPIKGPGSASPKIRLGELVEVLNDRHGSFGFAGISNLPVADKELETSRFAQPAASFAGNRIADALFLNQLGMQAASEAGAGGAGGIFGLRQSLNATISAGFDSNPFMGLVENTSAASIRVQLSPSLTRTTERNTFRLLGRAEHIEYLGLYDSLQNFGADLAASHRATERLEITGNLLFRSNTLATNLSDPFLVGELAPGDPVQPIGNDITVLGQGQRRTQYGAGAGLSYVFSERDQLSWTLTARADRFDEAGLVETNSLAQQVQYSRQIDEGLSVGAVVDTSFVDFVNQSDGSAGTITPQVQVRAALSPRVEVTGRVGLAITRRDFGGVEETSIAFAGSLSLCNRGERSNVCLNGSRQVLPAAIGGALLQTTAGLSYSYRLSELDTLQLGGNYATASEPSGVFGARDFESISGFAGYERRLDERLRVFVSSGYLQTSRNAAANSSNFQALIGVTFDLGQSR